MDRDPTECVHQKELIKARTDLAAAQLEVERLKAWLLKIDGGDSPCTDQSQLRQWAYEAVTLGKQP